LEPISIDRRNWTVGLEVSAYDARAGDHDLFRRGRIRGGLLLGVRHTRDQRYGYRGSEDSESCALPERQRLSLFHLETPPLISSEHIEVGGSCCCVAFICTAWAVDPIF